MIFDFGKYRGVIISIALFLLLDASVLMLNFYTSFQIAKDAAAVNLAGRQRMLSQRMMKSILDLQVSLKEQQPLQASIDELSKTTQLFDETLNSFAQGGAATGASGEAVTLEKLTSPVAIDSVGAANVIWQPFYQQIQQVIPSVSNNHSQLIDEQLSRMSDYGKSNNLTLLKLMNDLTVDLERVATSKASRLRLIQVVGIGLAVLNFFIIMVHFMRQLRESDQKVESARKETQQILDTVDQGLFLLDKDMQMGEQHSKEMARIFGNEHVSGQGFLDFIKRFVADKDLKNARSFLRILFNPRKKQRLLGDLNPLRQVSVQVPDGDNQYSNKFLRFSFTRVNQNNEVARILTAVSDITEEVTLTKKLETANKRNEQQLDILSVLLKTNPDMVPLFIESSFTAYNKINELLKSPSKSSEAYKAKANEIFALLHNVKGEASALSFTVIAELCHEFEEKLKDLTARTRVQGKDFLPMTILLNDLILFNTTFDELFSKVYAAQLNAPQVRQPEGLKQDWSHLHELNKQIAVAQSKQVELVTSGLNDFELSSSFVHFINSISVQFIRNAVAHGIEAEQDRFLSQKPETGLISITLAKRANGFYQYSFSDDGKGIDYDTVREVAIKKKIVSEIDADNMLPTQMINLIFSPKLSTSETVDINSGQGIGMYAIKQSVNEMGGKLSIKTGKGRGCTFTIMLPPTANVIEKVA